MPVRASHAARGTPRRPRVGHRTSPAARGMPRPASAEHRRSPTIRGTARRPRPERRTSSTAQGTGPLAVAEPRTGSPIRGTARGLGAERRTRPSPVGPERGGRPGASRDGSGRGRRRRRGGWPGTPAASSGARGPPTARPGGGGRPRCPTACRPPPRCTRPPRWTARPPARAAVAPLTGGGWAALGPALARPRPAGRAGSRTVSARLRRSQRRDRTERGGSRDGHRRTRGIRPVAAWRARGGRQGRLARAGCRRRAGRAPVGSIAGVSRSAIRPATRPTAPGTTQTT